MQLSSNPDVHIKLVCVSNCHKCVSDRKFCSLLTSFCDVLIWNTSFKETFPRLLFVWLVILGFFSSSDLNNSRRFQVTQNGLYMQSTGHWEVINGRSQGTIRLVSFPIPEAVPLRDGPVRRWRLLTAASTCQRFCSAFCMGAVVVVLQEITLEGFLTYPQLWGGSWCGVKLGCNSEGWQEEWGGIQRDWFNPKKGFLLQFECSVQSCLPKKRGWNLESRS